MLDRWTLPLIQKPLMLLAIRLNQKGIKADHITLTGFAIGILALPLLANQAFLLACLCILINRIADGVDGELARLQGATDAGAFLDIVLDFIFYSAVVFGFALANPENNAIAASGLIFSFMGTGASFLAYAVMAERNQIQNIVYPNKGLHYITGLAEGTETIIMLVLFCLIPKHFPVLAWFFAAVCYATTFIRVYHGYMTLKQSSKRFKKTK